MPVTAIWFGRLLVLLGIVGYGYGIVGGNPSMTAFIPAGFGLLLMILGHLSIAVDSMRKHLMHAAILVALVGAVIPAWRILSHISELTLNAAVVAQAAMAVICLVFVGFAVRSFIAARSEPEPETTGLDLD